MDLGIDLARLEVVGGGDVIFGEDAIWRESFGISS